MRQPWPTVGDVSQLSFFSAESVPPTVADLTGILAAPGQVVLVGSETDRAARLSIVVDRLWRAEGLAEMIAEAGVGAEGAGDDEDTPPGGPPAGPPVVALGRRWAPGGAQSVPRQ